MYNIIPWIFIDCSEIIFLPNSFTKLDSLTQIFDVQTTRLRQVSSHSSWWITTSETCLQMLIWFLFQDNICICQKRLWMCLWFCRSCIMKLSRGFFCYYFASYISKYASILRIWIGFLEALWWVRLLPIQWKKLGLNAHHVKTENGSWLSYFHFSYNKLFEGNV